MINKIEDFKKTFENIVTTQKNLERLVFQMGKQQELVENLLQSIDERISKLLIEAVNVGFDQHQVASQNILKIFSSLKKYDTVLTNIIDQVNKEIVGKKITKDSSNQNLNITVNNYYNAISTIEMKLLKIQMNLSQMK